MSKFKVFINYMILIFIYLVTFVLRLFQFTDSYDVDVIFKKIFSVLIAIFGVILILCRVIDGYFTFLILGICFLTMIILAAWFGISVFASYYDSINEQYCYRNFSELKLICKNKNYKLISEKLCEFTRYFTLIFFNYGLFLFIPFWIIFCIYNMTEPISDYQALVYLFISAWGITLSIFWKKRYKIYKRMREDLNYAINRDTVRFKHNRQEAKAAHDNFRDDRYDNFRYYNAFKDSEEPKKDNKNSNTYNSDNAYNSDNKLHRAASVSKYFCGCKTSAELKKRYHELAKTMHPDAGGDEDSFQEMTSEYDIIEEKWRNLGI